MEMNGKDSFKAFFLGTLTLFYDFGVLMAFSKVSQSDMCSSYVYVYLCVYMQQRPKCDCAPEHTQLHPLGSQNFWPSQIRLALHGSDSLVYTESVLVPIDGTKVS